MNTTKDNAAKEACDTDKAFLDGVELVTSEILRLIAHSTRTFIFDKDKDFAIKVKLAATHVLKKRGIVPYGHDVAMGKAEPFTPNFNR